MQTLQLVSGARLSWRPAPWDAAVLGHGCAEILSCEAADAAALTELLAAFNQLAVDQAIRLAYTRAEPTAMHKQAFHAAGFYFAEASYLISQPRLQASAGHDRLVRRGLSLAPAEPGDLPAIRDILANDFAHGRIHEDPWVRPDQAAARNRAWLDDLLRQGHEVLAYRHGDSVIGLHIQHSAGSRTDWVLTGVQRSHALLGASLWAEALRLNRLRGLREVHTLVSAANLPILNLYRQLGFQFDSLLCGFHRRYGSVV